MSTKLDLDALEKLLAEATPGPWHREMLELAPGMLTLGVGSESRPVCIVNGVVESPVGNRDVVAICSLRNAAEQLIAAARRLEDLERAGHYLQANGLSYVADTAEYELTVDGLLALARDHGWDPKGKDGG